MRHKNKSLISLLIICLLLTISCEDILDTDRNDELSKDQAFSEPDGFASVMASVYGEFQRTNYYQRNFILGSELLCDNLRITVSNRNFLTGFPSNNAHVSIWREVYRGMLSINDIIERKVNLEDTGFANRAEGEAKFLRALFYHDLVKTYARNPGFLDANFPADQNGIPLILTPTDLGGNLRVPRNSVEEVYAQIESDLIDAINLLGTEGSILKDANGQNSKFVASAVAAKALLARVYLFWGRWQDAATMADQAISDSGLTLQAGGSLIDIFAADIESIFSIRFTPEEASPFSSLSNFMGGTAPEFVLRQDMIDAFEANDKRFTQLIRSGEKNGEPITHSLKFNNYVSVGADNVPIIRLSELYLIRAEANFENNSNIGDSPLNDINAIRLKSGISNHLSIDMDKILLERRLELAFEGHRYWDLKRRGLDIPKGISGVDCLSECIIDNADFRLIAPIAQQEIVINPSLIQNPGYN